TLAFRYLADIDDRPEAFLSLFSDGAAAQAWLDRYRARLAEPAWPAAERPADMLPAHPLHLLRHHLAQRASAAAQQGDAHGIDRLWSLLRAPYAARRDAAVYAAPPPAGAPVVSVSCSS